MKLISKYLALGLLLVTGACSSRPPLPPYDSKQAEHTLVATLDAWKQGQAYLLAQRVPPIRFEDEDYRSGLWLTDYRLSAPEIGVRAFVDVPVTLSLRDRQGKGFEKNVAYQIALEPRLAVLRSD